MKKENNNIKKVIEILNYNKKIAESYLNDSHTKDFIIETKGLIDGYKFAITVCEIVKKGKEKEDKLKIV